VKQINMLIYMVSFDKEPDQVCCLVEEDVEARGGTAALEYEMGKSCRWFARLGRIEKLSVVGNGMRVSAELLNSLVDAWEERGAPKQSGTGMNETTN
jgi:hypothetical protein